MFIKFLDKELEKEFLNLNNKGTPWMSNYKRTIEKDLWDWLYNFNAKKNNIENCNDFDLLHKLSKWLNQLIDTSLYFWSFNLVNKDWSTFNKEISNNASISNSINSLI